MMKYNSRAI